MSEEDHSAPLTQVRKSPYFLGIFGGILWYGLALLEPLHGPKLWTIFLCGSFAVWISVLKLRSLIHGVGWVFPRTNSVLLAAVTVEVWLFIWFSH
jgi:hypothetical protein